MVSVGSHHGARVVAGAIQPEEQWPPPRKTQELANGLAKRRKMKGWHDAERRGETGS